jgi:hypothetical protein
VPCVNEGVEIDPVDDVFRGSFPEDFAVDAGPLGWIREVATTTCG